MFIVEFFIQILFDWDSFCSIGALSSFSWNTANNEIHCKLIPLTFSESAYTKRTLLLISQGYSILSYTSPTTLYKTDKSFRLG